MVKVNDIITESTENEIQYIQASLVADTAFEVESMGAIGDNVVGLAPNTRLTLGSTCLCATGDFGMLDSSGVWHF